MNKEKFANAAGHTAGDGSLRSILVITGDSGRVLGNLNRVFFDATASRISALSFRRRFFGKEFYVEMSEVEKIGEDVVLVKTEDSTKELTRASAAPGTDLMDFQGAWAYGTDGKPLGVILDFDVNPESWRVDTLYLAEGPARTVSVGNLTVTRDSVIAEARMAGPVIQQPVRPEGLLARLFGDATVTRANMLLHRVLRRPPESGLQRWQDDGGQIATDAGAHPL